MTSPKASALHDVGLTIRLRWSLVLLKLGGIALLIFGPLKILLMPGVGPGAWLIRAVMIPPLLWAIWVMPKALRVVYGAFRAKRALFIDRSGLWILESPPIPWELVHGITWAKNLVREHRDIPDIAILVSVAASNVDGYSPPPNLELCAYRYRGKTFSGVWFLSSEAFVAEPSELYGVLRSAAARWSPYFDPAWQGGEAPEAVKLRMQKLERLQSEAPSFEQLQARVLRLVSEGRQADDPELQAVRLACQRPELLDAHWTARMHAESELHQALDDARRAAIALMQAGAKSNDPALRAAWQRYDELRAQAAAESPSTQVQPLP